MYLLLRYLDCFRQIQPLSGLPETFKSPSLVSEGDFAQSILGHISTNLLQSNRDKNLCAETLLPAPPRDPEEHTAKEGKTNVQNEK